MKNLQVVDRDLLNQVYGIVNKQVWIQVKDQVFNQVWSQVYGKVNTQLRKIREKIR